MTPAETIFFIDANQYLDLFRMPSGKKLLAPLLEQKDHIFVTSQIVDEVERNKVECAAAFLAEQAKGLIAANIAIPEHLFASTDDRVTTIRTELNQIAVDVSKAKADLLAMASDLLARISRAEDEVSIALGSVFERAINPTNTELAKARLRRELGRAPGKKSDPLGDQLTWEQTLSRSKGKKAFWIVSKDADYATKFGGDLHLNAALFSDLVKAVGFIPDIYCFDTIPDAIRHFAETVKLKAESLPSPAESEELNVEQHSIQRSNDDNLPLISGADVARVFRETNRPIAEFKAAADAARVFRDMSTPIAEFKAAADAARMFRDMSTPIAEFKAAADAARMFRDMSTPIAEFKAAADAVRVFRETKISIADFKAVSDAARMFREIKSPIAEIKAAADALRMIRETKGPMADIRAAAKAMRIGQLPLKSQEQPSTERIQEASGSTDTAPDSPKCE